MRVIPKDKVIFSFNAEHPCQYSVEDGETFWVETDDCYSGQITDCSVGPIEVRGAKPGDTLCVEILAIELGRQGVMVTSKGLGVLGDRITEADTKVIPIEDGFACFSDKIRLPLTPMVGVCGVAPRPGLDIHCAVPGDHGSNMDTKMVKAGARVYLPVSVPGDRDRDTRPDLSQNHALQGPAGEQTGHRDSGSPLFYSIRCDFGRCYSIGGI